ncbi:MAG: preprotein translocase subunit SecG [Gammaproteobacteria bacterium]|nr:preprotein translocase subunit SecG [Gammaproteobacteria bacterium]
MGNVEKVFLVLLVLDALALIGLVLLQQGKGADVGAAFGSGSSGTVFGSSGGANFLTRLTTFFAVLFFLLSFGLAYLAKERTQSSTALPVIELLDQENQDSESALEVDNEEIPNL